MKTSHPSERDCLGNVLIRREFPANSTEINPVSALTHITMTVSNYHSILLDGLELIWWPQARGENHEWHTDPSQYTNEQKHWLSVQWCDCVCVLRGVTVCVLCGVTVCVFYESLWKQISASLHLVWKINVQMFGVSKILFVCFLGKIIILLLGKNAFNISNDVFYELSIRQRILKKNVSQFQQHNCFQY